jgi:hypothetical protein
MWKNSEFRTIAFVRHTEVASTSSSFHFVDLAKFFCCEQAYRLRRRQRTPLARISHTVAIVLCSNGRGWSSTGDTCKVVALWRWRSVEDVKPGK